MWPSTRLDVLARSTPEGRGIRPCRELAQMQAREGGLWAAENDGAAAQDLPSRGRADRRDVDHCHDHVQLGAHAHTGASGMKRSVQSRASNSPGPTELCPLAPQLTFFSSLLDWPQWCTAKPSRLLKNSCSRPQKCLDPLAENFCQ